MARPKAIIYNSYYRTLEYSTQLWYPDTSSYHVGCFVVAAGAIVTCSGRHKIIGFAPSRVPVILELVESTAL
eukprot:scaffold1221_cov207-Amphora_coffeaeformis.AAC.39